MHRPRRSHYASARRAWNRVAMTPSDAQARVLAPAVCHAHHGRQPQCVQPCAVPHAACAVRRLAGGKRRGRDGRTADDANAARGRRACMHGRAAGRAQAAADTALVEYVPDTLSALALLINFRKYEGANPILGQVANYRSSSVLVVRLPAPARRGAPRGLTHGTTDVARGRRRTLARAAWGRWVGSCDCTTGTVRVPVQLRGLQRRIHRPRG